VRGLLCLALGMLAAARALALAPGDTLPRVQIQTPGEVRLVQQRFAYAPWDSSALAAGKLQVLQYLAARSSARELNRPFTDRLEHSGIPLEHYHVTTIVNLDDALFGTRSLVLAELESNKRRYSLSTIVADADGTGRVAWGLAPKSSAILILDANGRVLFFREGAMSEQEIERALELVRKGA
jgi:YtfJ family uncharacterized protein